MAKTEVVSDAAFLSIRQAAHEMQVGTDTTYRLAKNGSIPSVRIGGQIRIPRSALVEYLTRQALEHADRVSAGVSE